MNRLVNLAILALSVSAGHVEFPQSPSELAVFEREHPHRRLVLFEPTNKRSLEILRKVLEEDSVLPTAAGTYPSEYLRNGKPDARPIQFAPRKSPRPTS